MVDEEAPDPVVLVETVGDNGDAGGAGTEETSAINAEAAMSTARAQAEARRKRILEKANNRMKYVNGEQVQDEEEKKTSRSNAARIRAARQRRYGKKAAAVAPATTAPALAASPSITATPSDENSATAEVSTSTPEVLQEKALGAEIGETTSAEDASASATAVGAPSKKKYVGVARMRRKMLVKKKMEEFYNDPGASSSAGSESAKASLASDGKSSKGNPAAGTTSVGSPFSPMKVQTVPIYMHMVIILLLFVTGFDVGIQQFHVDIDVRTKVAVQEYGVPFLQRNPWHPLKPKTTEKDSKQTLAEKLSSSSPLSSTGELLDEFDEEIDEEYIPPNIDPIFRMDLDELTKGPGIVKQMARGAISIHRLILWFFYYAPVGFFGAILSIPTAFIQSPPALFLAAVILRQVVGNGILGATIPEDSEDDEDGTKKQNNIEVMAMAKNFVKNFFMTTFPTVVKLYDAYLHLKADMYVVLCGVFFGLAWSHLHSDPLSCDADAPLASGSGDVLEGEL